MPYDPAIEKAVADLKQLAPYVAAAKSGADYDGSKFKVPFFDRTFFVGYPEGKIEEQGGGVPSAPPFVHLILLHYLINARGMAVADEWIPYRLLPGAALFEPRFRQMAIAPLIRTFGNDVEGFKKAGLALRGVPMDRTGDAAFRFLALPRIPVACILYLGEDEIPPSINILFDAAAPSYLPTEDLSYLGMYLAVALKKHQQKR